MVQAVRLALTGTPGTGKTTIAGLFAAAGWSVVSVEELATNAGALGEVDPSDDAHPIDLDLLHDSLSESWKTAPLEPTLIDGHLSHHLPVDAVAVLRCDPATLRGRLESRGYAAAKTESNLEWELLGGAWNERGSGEELGDESVPWAEFDTSEASAEFVFSAICEWISDGFKPASPEGVVDWIARMDD